MLSWTAGLFRRRGGEPTAAAAGPQQPQVMTIAPFESLAENAECYWDPYDPEQRLLAQTVHPLYMEEWLAVQQSRPSTTSVAQVAVFDINEAPDPKEAVIPGEIPEVAPCEEPEGGEPVEDKPEEPSATVDGSEDVDAPEAPPTPDVPPAPPSTPASSNSAPPLVLQPPVKVVPDAALIATCKADRELVESLRQILAWPSPQDEHRRFAEDALLLRFLRARNRDIPAAAAMLRATQQWRKEFKLDSLLSTKDPHEHIWGALGPNCFHGYDYQGRPVYYERTGEVRLRAYQNHGLEEQKIVWRHVRYVEYITARCQHSSSLHRRNIESIVSIQDLQGLPYVVEPAAYRVFRDITRIDQAHYPERLHKMILINAPLRFRSVWFVIRPWLHERTRNKVEILGTNFLPRLMELIPPSQIPAYLGGKCRCVRSQGDSCVRRLRPSPPPAEWMADQKDWDWPPTGGLDLLPAYGPEEKEEVRN